MTTPPDLTRKRCTPCEGGVPALSPAGVRELLRALDPAWQVAADGRSIARSFAFDSYARTIGFVNAIAWIAESEGHHPDLEVGYGRCRVVWSTHAVGGLTENDFICAARVDRLGAA